MVAFWPFGNVDLRKVTTANRTAALLTLQPLEIKAVSAESLSLAKFLMNENRRISDYKLASVRSLEKKATGQITAAGTILALLTAFGTDLPIILRAFPIAFLVVAIMAYIRASYVRTASLPSFSYYVSLEVIADPQNEARIAALAASAWGKYGLELERANTIKARYVRTGNFWLVLALLTILLLAFLPALPKGPSEGTSPKLSRMTRSLQNVQRQEHARRSTPESRR